jgi:hypothetical protein
MKGMSVKVLFLWATAGCTFAVSAEGGDWEKEWSSLNARVSQIEAKSARPAVSLHGVMVGNFQTLAVQNASPGVDEGSRGVFVFQPEVSVRRSEQSEFFFKFGFAGGNGLTGMSPFVLSPWAADAEDDVKNINGRNRDYLLNAYYTHSLALNNSRWEFVGGIIDATDYLDENAFANDEFSQFMNASLVNGANVFAPSYDVGGAVRFNRGPFSVNAVIMDVGENDDGRSFTFYGAQVGVQSPSVLGVGNVRIALEATDKNFVNTARSTLESRQGAIVSVDQEFGPIFGGWARLGTQSGNASVNYRHLYSGGLNVRGALWGRSLDNFGIGHSFLNNGNNGVAHSDVSEAYVRVQLAEGLAVNADTQFLRDSYEPDAGECTKGWISSLMVSTDF